MLEDAHRDMTVIEQGTLLDIALIGGRSFCSGRAESH